MMKPDLHQLFHRLMDDPGAVDRLKHLVLNLAVRGQLLTQNSTDEPAVALIRQIAAEKAARKQKSGDARIKFEPDPDPSKLPMALPKGWAVQSFENLFLFIDYRGNTPLKTTEGVPLITAKNVRMGFLNREPREFISSDTFKAWMTRGNPAIGDIFFTTEAPLANVCLNGIAEPFALAQRVICLQPYGEINTRFLMIALMSDVLQSLIDAHATGLTAKGIKAAKLKPLPIPIPPLAEQQRIANRVDELMALCDQLEAARAEREAARDRLAAASLARLNAPHPETFADDARFSLDALPALTARAGQMRSLRDTVCRMALLGQFSDDERWPTTPSHLRDFVRLQSGYAFKSEWFGPTGVRLLRNANVAHGRVNWADEAFLPHELCKGYERFMLNVGDLVLSLNRPFIATGTKVAQVRDSDLPALLVQRVARLEIAETLSPDYLLLWLQCSLFQEQVQPVSTNVAPHIAPADIGRAKIFVPDIDEQRRVVDQAKQLMALCDQLEASLQSTAEHRSRLLEVLLRNAVESGHHADAPARVDEVAPA